MKKKPSANPPRRYPWVLVIFLVLYVCVTALAVTALVRTPATAEPAPQTQPNTTPSHPTNSQPTQPQPTQPEETLPPEPQHQAVFETLFTEPDWEALYALAGIADTVYEDAGAYESYMNARLGDEALTYQEITTDLPDQRRYLVFHGAEKIAAFTMAQTPQWSLSGVELFFQRAISVTVEKQPEHTVYINGVALDDSHTIRTLETTAENYLPEGVHGYRAHWQSVSGLLVQPEITVLDENGQSISMELDTERGIYRPVTEAPAEITEAEAALVRKTAIADAKYAIGALTNSQLKAYFDENSPLYRLLIENPRNLQKYTRSSIDESAMVVYDFCRYSDKLFSAKVKLTQNIIRKDGTLKVYTADKTYFFRLCDDGVYRAIAYTNESATQATQFLRLTFMIEEENVTQMVNSTDTAILLPEVSPPEGQALIGWATKSDVMDGKITMTVRLLPDGTILGGLEPMTLYPIFQECAPENPL